MGFCKGKRWKVSERGWIFITGELARALALAKLAAESTDAIVIPWISNARGGWKAKLAYASAYA